ncbi:MAG TPA: hypothetical protein VF384_07090 [Planctomycetota bacterium]
MTKKGSKPPTDAVAGARPAVDLVRDLADRERQLRDLTQQALGFLEELAESRRRNEDRDQLAQRIGDLERALADARDRLRHAGGCVAAETPPAAAQRVPLAVVFWGSDAFAEAAESSVLCGDVPVAWVGLPGAVLPDVDAGRLQTIVHRDAHTEAQCWNLAMATTSAECVLLLGPGARLLDPPSFPDAVPPNAAVLCPRIERDESVEVGCEESDDLLRLRARPATGDSDALAPVPWAAAQAFVVRRAVFERIGLFDESLAGPATLLDYTLRARRQNFEVFGVPGLAVAADEQEASIESPTDERMRLLLLAAHRPAMLGKALAETPLLWTLGNEVRGFLSQLLALLPLGEGLADQRAVLDQICVDLVATAMPSIEVARNVTAARTALLRAFAAADLPAGGEEISAALRACEAKREAETPVTALASLAGDIALCARLAAAAASTAQQLRAELQDLDADRHAHMARAEQSEGARSAAQAQLDQVQRWLVDAQQDVRQSHEARQQVTAKLADQLDETRSELARSQQQLAQVRSELAGSQQWLERERAELSASQQQLEQTRTELARLQSQLQATSRAHDEKERETRDLRNQFTRMARIAGLTDAADPGTLRERLTQLHEDSQRFSSTLQSAGATDAAALLARLDSLGQRLDAALGTIGERERWIAALLDEVGKRRLFPRALFDHERALLERVRRTP